MQSTAEPNNSGHPKFQPIMGDTLENLSKESEGH